MKYVAAFDIGTTEVKGILVSKDGEVTGEASVTIDTFYEGEGRIEQEPGQWWRAVLQITRNWWKSGFHSEEIQAVVCTGQMQDCIPIDHAGNPVRRAILYSDNRGIEQAERILKRIGEKNIQQATGNHFNGQMPFAKMLWMKEVEPENFNKTDTFLFSSKDYIVRKLTGNSTADPTTGATTGLMDIRNRAWFLQWVEDFGITSSVLPELIYAHQEVGRISKEVSICTGLQLGIPVFNGAGDGGASTIGAGAAEEGKIYAYLGTTGWVAVPVKKTYYQGNGIFQLAHLPEKLWISIAPLMNAGNVHQWVTSVFGEGLFNSIGEMYSFIEEEIHLHPIKKQSPLFLPYLHGERCPIQDFSAMGTLIGMGPAVSRGELCSAILEGVALSIRQVMELVLQGKAIDTIALIGGGSRSHGWCQLISNACQTKVVVPDKADVLPAIGCAAAAFVGLGWANSYTEFIRMYLTDRKGVSFFPDTGSGVIYQERYDKFLKIYPAVKRLF